MIQKFEFYTECAEPIELSFDGILISLIPKIKTRTGKQSRYEFMTFKHFNNHSSKFNCRIGRKFKIKESHKKADINMQKIPEKESHSGRYIRQRHILSKNGDFNLVENENT